jgi:Domain of unknown function (DUF4373)
MARPKKLTLDFFIHDSDASQDPKIKALRKRFGNDGYAAYFTLLEILCRQKAVLLDLSKAWQVDATAEDCHLRDAAHLFAIVEYCVLVELFDKQLWESDRCLCSLGLRDRYIESLKARLIDAQRKGQSTQAEALCEKISAISLSFPVVFHPENPQKMSFPPVIHPESTQTTDYRLQTTDPEEEKETIGQARLDRVSPPAEKAKQVKKPKVEYSADFEKFWTAYPRKVNKQEAEKAYKKLIAERTSPEAINKLLEKRIRFEWLDRINDHIPHAATFLRGESFAEEIEITLPAETRKPAVKNFTPADLFAKSEP